MKCDTNFQIWEIHFIKTVNYQFVSNVNDFVILDRTCYFEKLHTRVYDKFAPAYIVKTSRISMSVMENFFNPTRLLIAIVFIGIVGMGINDAVYIIWNQRSGIAKK